MGDAPQHAGFSIRAEGACDSGAVAAVHRAAFPTPAEAALVARLRANGQAVLSLVAARERDDAIVGHVLFSPLTLEPPPAAPAQQGVGLGPLAVLPEQQRRGTGAALLRAGLAACATLGCGFAVVLGDPAYYARFGFRRAGNAGLGNEYGAGDAFMVVEILPGGLPRGGGLVRYAAEFADPGLLHQ